MKTPELLEAVASEKEAEMAKVAQRCLMTALDHSNARRIALVDEKGGVGDAPVLELPPQALRFFADMLGMMARHQPIVLMPQKHELTTQEAAAFLNVSRPFVIKQIGAGKLACRKVGRHRRVELQELNRYLEEQQKASQDALQELADMAQEGGMGY